MHWLTRLLVPSFCLAFSLASVHDAQALASPAEVVARQASVADPGHPAIPVAIWAPTSGDSLGLIVISHGTGAGQLSHVDTALALAGAGFVVVAPLHPGDNFRDQSIVGKPQWFVDRSRHLTKVIDYMAGEWDGRARLAASKVGVFGFSAGGTTALISIGGVPDPGLVTTHCAKRPEFACNLMTPEADQSLPAWTHDTRVAAAVIVAPGLGFAFGTAGLASVHTPVQLWSGEADDTVPYATNAGLIRTRLPNAPQFHAIKDATHLSFLAPCSLGTPPQLCQDRPGFDRAAFHAEFNQSVVAFFQAALADRTSAASNKE